MENLLKSPIKRLILDDGIFWTRVEKIYHLVNPIVKWITLLEADTPRISLVPEAFAEIRSNIEEKLSSAPISKQEEKMLMNAVKSRTEMSLVPLHYAANMLDPKLLGKSLTPDQQVEGIEYIDSMTSNSPMYTDFNTDILVDLAQFRQKEGAWGKPYLWKTAEKLDSINWWKAVCTASKLRLVAIDILGMPPTSAATERSFSSYSLVHTKKRNRLTAERAGKLVYVAHNLKLLSVPGTILKKSSTLQENNVGVVSIDSDSESDNDTLITNVSDDGDEPDDNEYELEEDERDQYALEEDEREEDAN